MPKIKTKENKTKNKKESVEELKKQIKELTEKNEQLTAQLKKALADYNNLQNNNAYRVNLMLDQMKKKVALKLIELADDISYAFEALDKSQFSESAKNWLDGLLQTLSKIDSVLGELGVSVRECKVGDEFDSTFHEAIGEMPGGKKGKIANVVQKCFVMNDNVIRPARVLTYSGSSDKK